MTIKRVKAFRLVQRGFSVPVAEVRLTSGVKTSSPTLALIHISTHARLTPLRL